MVDNGIAILLMLVSLIREDLHHYFSPVTDWYERQLPTIQPWAQWLIDMDAFRRVAGIMCALYCLSVLVLAFEYHASHVRPGASVKNFRKGYFTLLTIQIIPLMITGFSLNDGFIIWTRAMMLVTIIISYALVTTADGTFNTRRYELWALFWITACILGPMTWMHDGVSQQFVAHHEKIISWIVVITMVVFTIKGQWSLAVDLFRHFMAGDKTVKRFRSQIPRFLMLLLPIGHYWFAPSSAAPVLGQDPILLAHISGAIGSFAVILMSGIGFAIAILRGIFRRKPKVRTVSA